MCVCVCAWRPACVARGCVGVCRSDPVHKVTSLLTSDGDLEVAPGEGGGSKSSSR